MSLLIWKKCLTQLQNELSPTEFSMWIRPLKAKLKNNILELYAPNKFVLDWVKDKYLKVLYQLLNNFSKSNSPILNFKITPKNVTITLKKKNK